MIIFLIIFRSESKSFSPSRQGVSKFSFELSGPDGESFFRLGMPSKELYEADSLRWTDLTGSTWWSFRGALAVGSKVLLSGDFILDSGTSYIALPPKLTLSSA